MSLNHSYLNNRNSSFYSTTNNISYNYTNNKTTTIKVAIRLRPLLPHEDFEYWIVDPINNLITSSLVPLAEKVKAAPTAFLTIQGCLGAKTSSYEFPKIFLTEVSLGSKSLLNTLIKYSINHNNLKKVLQAEQYFLYCPFL